MERDIIMAQHAQYPHEQQNAGHGEQVIAIHPIMSMHCEFACKHDEERAVDGDIDHRGQQSVEERGQIGVVRPSAMLSAR